MAETERMTSGEVVGYLLEGIVPDEALRLRALEIYEPVLAARAWRPKSRPHSSALSARERTGARKGEVTARVD